MGLISILFRDPVMFFLIAIPLLYSIIFHEVAHGVAAYFFGDDTAKNYGRLSLNPVVHLDIIGVIALFFVGFGWAKPVPVNYHNLKNFRIGLICVSLAGCLTNILIAALAVFLLKILHVGVNSYTAIALLVIAKINVLLGVFNLIPIPPLDGSKILMGFLPYDAQRVFMRIEPYGFFILLFLLITGFLNPVVAFLQKLVFSLIT